MQSKKLTALLVRILEKIISDKKQHAYWLNTLSFLEYIGTRKILKSLPAKHFNVTLLEHINEEARHSLFFKKLAQKILKKNLSFHFDEMVCAKDAEAYFQKIDKKAKDFAQYNPLLNYLYTTYMIESRAVLVYSIYNKVLDRNNFPFSLNPVLKDEEKHLDFVVASIRQLDPFAEKHFEELKTCEYSEYFSLLISLEEKILLPVYKTSYLNKQQSVSKQQHL